MIARYTRPEMGTIWSDQNKFTVWLEIELLACEAQAELGVIPRAAVDAIRSRASFSIDRIDEIEREVKHDVIAFLTNVAEHVGAEARFIHLGMTSSDVLDTCLAVQMKQSGELLLKGLRGLADILARRAREFKHTVMVGRTHGVHAEPTTFGLKLALWYDETRRNISRLEAATKGDRRRSDLRRRRDVRAPRPQGGGVRLPGSSALRPRRSRRRFSSEIFMRSS